MPLIPGGGRKRSGRIGRVQSPQPLGKPRGMWWDNQRQLLSILFTNGWTSGGPEWYPVVIEYEAVNG